VRVLVFGWGWGGRFGRVGWFGWGGLGWVVFGWCVGWLIWFGVLQWCLGWFFGLLLWLGVGVGCLGLVGFGLGFGGVGGVGLRQLGAEVVVWCVGRMTWGVLRSLFVGVCRVGYCALLVYSVFRCDLLDSGVGEFVGRMPAFGGVGRWGGLGGRVDWCGVGGCWVLVAVVGVRRVCGWKVMVAEVLCRGLE